jgi:hypothetical protein
MFRSAASGAVLALALGGCGGLPKMDPDRTPVNPTAVLETQMVNQGTKDFPAFEGVTLSYTRANMQRIEFSVKGNGTFTRLQGAADSQARIERLDRRLAWMLDAKSRRYVECPIKGCAGPIPGKLPARKSADGDGGRDTQCRLKLGNTTVTVEPTGRKRNINGFDTEQYDVQWMVTFRDNVSRKATSTVTIDLWMTPVTPALKEAMTLEKTYARARAKFLGLDADTDRSVELPFEVGRMIGSFLSANVSPTDRSMFLAGARKLDNVSGQPILMNVKWSLAGDACSMDESMKDTGDKPLLTFTSEVKSHKMEPLHDSLFEPPKDYKRRK